MTEISVFWFRRDLRLHDNTALNKALSSNQKVLCVFIFDENILNELLEDDARVSFIYERLKLINEQLQNYKTSLLVLKGKPLEIWQELTENYQVKTVFSNKDYEPYARNRDAKIAAFLKEKGIIYSAFKDQVIHEENDVLKNDGKPYTVFTPYKNKWLEVYKGKTPEKIANTNKFLNTSYVFPTLNDIGFIASSIKVKDYNLNHLDVYKEKRDFPYADITSYLSPHLRFGTVSIREVISKLNKENSVFLSELIWREFFMQILYHFPHVVT
ncbi:deoxyribodipyrimidine photo-lyase, partial [Seonamhaeicola sp.]|uniref:deoxyribodipyrimidine photo-lyase n=1 Tax=Seonamhaeicola sp. TaxID=1912245 RepID=UPI0035633631